MEKVKSSSSDGIPPRERKRKWNDSEDGAGEDDPITKVLKLHGGIIMERLQHLEDAVVDRIESLADVVEKRLDDVLKRIDIKLKNIEELVGDGENLNSGRIVPAPASNEDELNSFIDMIKDHDMMATMIESPNLRTTIRNFIKCTMQKDLALRFSWTGLGDKRKRTKTSFKNHRIFQLMTAVLEKTVHRGTSHEMISLAVKRVLSGVTDWNGGRSARGSVNADSTRQELALRQFLQSI